LIISRPDKSEYGISVSDGKWAARQPQKTSNELIVLSHFDHRKIEQQYAGSGKFSGISPLSIPQMQSLIQMAGGAPAIL
jgi:hypothetical protein